MKYSATQKFVRIAPRKVRLVADVARQLPPTKAAEMLPYLPKSAAIPVAKVIKSAIANAVIQGANPEALRFSQIQVGEGPVLKRWRAASRGRVHGYVKKMSHITVVVEASEVAVPKQEEKPKAEVKKSTKKISKPKTK